MKFREALVDFGVMQSITFPGSKVDQQYPGAASDYMQLINHHNSQMSKSVLASFDESHGGDRSLADFGHQSDALFPHGVAGDHGRHRRG